MTAGVWYLGTCLGGIHYIAGPPFLSLKNPTPQFDPCDYAQYKPYRSESVKVYYSAYLFVSQGRKRNSVAFVIYDDYVTFKRSWSNIVPVVIYGD